MVTWNGTIMVATNSQKQTSRPGNLKIAHAYAASTLVSACAAVTASATTRLFQNNRAIGTCAMAVEKFASVGCAGQSAKVPAKISRGGFSAVDSIHSIGKTTSNAARPSSRCAERRSAAIVRAPLAQQELDSRQHQEDEEHDRRGRRRVADAEVFEAELVDEIREVVARLGRAALREDLRRDEEILRAEDERRQQHEQRGRAQQRKRDALEDAPLGCAVDPRRLVHLARNRDEAGDVQDEIEAERLPGGDDDDAP